MNQIVLQIPREIEDELKEFIPNYSLDMLKVVAIEAIAKLISVEQSTQHQAEQAEERKLAAEQLQLGTESRIIKLGELNQIRE